jgi:HSP20 family molecular chaperone IbpA
MGLFQMKEEKDKYILSARLPEEQAKNIKVAVDNDRILKITSEATNSSAAAGSGSYSSSNFSQSLSLPGPVKTEKISMGYKDGCFEIDLPKA